MGFTTMPPWLITVMVWVTVLLQATQASPAGYDLAERSATSKKCSYSSTELAILKANLGAPLAFCRYWTGVSFKRTHSPFAGLTAAEITSVCKCVVATPSILGKAATSAMATASPTSHIKNLFALEKAVASPLPFCKYWYNSNFVRENSPFPGLSAPAISSVCSSVTASPILVAKTTTKKTSSSTKKHTTTSAHKHVSSSTTKTGATKKSTVTKKTISSKKTATRSSSKPNTYSSHKSTTSRATVKTPSASTRAKTSPSSTKPHSSSFVNNGRSTSSLKSVHSSAAATAAATTPSAVYSPAASSAAASSAVSSSASNSSTTGTFTTTNSTGNNSVAGVEYVADPVTLAGPAKATLGPIAPIGLDLTSLDNLSPAVTVPMYYGSADNSTNATVAKLSTTFAYQSIVLDHTVFITSVTCPTTGELVAVFNEQSAFLHSESQWTANGSVILITSACGNNGSNAMFLTSSVNFDTVDLTATAQGSIVNFADVLDNMDMDFGSVSSANATNSTTYTPNCAIASANSTLATAACGTNFDQLLDDSLGYYSGADVDQQVTLAALSPGSSTSTLSRRNWWSKLKSIVKAVVAPIKAAVKAVAKVVTPLLPKIVVQAISAVASVALNVVNTYVAIANFVATGSYSKTLNMGIDVGPAASFPSKLESSPWGEQFKFFEWKPEAADEKESEKVKQWKEELLKVADKLIGEADPEPGIEMFCVDCGINGHLTAVGSLSVSLVHGVTNLQVSLNGNLYAGVFVGVNAFAEYKKELTQNLITVGLPGFEIPDIVVIGPSVSLGVQAGLDVTAEGQILVGASMNWPSISANLNLLDKSKSYQSGFTPIITKKFEAHGDITLTADLGLPLTVAFGVNILNGKYKKGIELIDTPAITATAEFQADFNATSSSDSGTSVSASVNQGDGCYGVEWSVMLTNDLELNLLDLANYQLAHWQSPPLASGCIGTSITAAATSTSTTKTSSTVKATTTTSSTKVTTSSSSSSSSSSGISSKSSSISSSGIISKSSIISSTALPSISVSSVASLLTLSSTSTTKYSNFSATVSSFYSNATTSGYFNLTTSLNSNVTATSTSAAAATTTGICGSTYTSADGYAWTIQCSTDYRTGSNLAYTPYTNIYSCINACDGWGTACKGIVWVYSGQADKYCYLKTDVSSPTPLPSGIGAYAAVRGSNIYATATSSSSYNSSLALSSSSSSGSYNSSLVSSSSSSTVFSSQSSSTSSSRSSSISSSRSSSISSSSASSTISSSSSTSASPTPTYTPLGSCPGVNNTLFLDEAGNKYRIECSEDYTGYVQDTYTGLASLEACINMCDSSDESGCVGVSYSYGGSYKRSSCSIKYQMNSNPTLNANTTSGYSYNVDSAYLVANASSASASSSSSSASSTSATSSSLLSSSSTSSVQSSAPTSTVLATTNGRCGPDNGNMVCTGGAYTGSCCSEFGWCGTGSEYCDASENCQSDYGTCDTSMKRLRRDDMFSGANVTSTADSDSAATSTIADSGSAATSTIADSGLATTSTTEGRAAATSSISDDSGSAATTTVAASAATPTVISSEEANVTITDTQSMIQLMPADNGNLFVQLYTAANATSNFAMSNNLILGDAAGRLLHYYPETMSTYSASRLRLAAWGSIPHSANLISFAPLQVTSNTTFLVGLDSLGNHYYPVTCSFQGPMPMKVFLVKDSMADLSFLADEELQTVMTGGVVDQCNPLALTAHGVAGFS